MLRICLLCTDEHVFQPPMLAHLLERHRGEVVAALIFDRPRRDRIVGAVRRALALDGWRAVPRLAVHAARHAWQCLVDPAYHYFRVERLFGRFDVPVWRFARPNDPECVARLRALQPDILYNLQPWRLQRDVLSIPRLACVNQHTGDLRRYRGLEPVVRAQIQGDTEYHITLHTMTEDYDAGRVLAFAVLPMTTSAFECYRAAFDRVPDLFDRAAASLTRAADGPTDSAAAVDPRTTPCYGRFAPDEIKRFRQLGLRYL